MSKSLLLTALLALAAPALAADYVQAPGSTLAFAGKYQGEVFTGAFPGFVARLHFDPQQLGDARLDVDIPLATATTSNDSYQSELRGSGFFDATKFPRARFEASKFRALGNNRYAADGTLSLHGISKPVTLTFDWTAGAQPVLTGRASVSRLAFGVGGGQWADTKLIPDAIAVSTKVKWRPAK
ncbi:MAG: YceI family protein [Xanthomonadaceae bacterium]|nr:YceI family protein [Xanthomonadaceae bacterium]